MAVSPNTTPMPKNLRPVIEAQIERLIALLDAMDPDHDLEENGDLKPSLGWSPDNRSYIDAGDDREGDWSDSEPTMGATEVKPPSPAYLFGGIMSGLFPALRERGALTYSSAGFFSQDFAWGGSTRATADDCEPCCEDEGAQCDDEGAISDNGIGDSGGLADAYGGAAWMLEPARSQKLKTPAPNSTRSGARSDTATRRQRRDIAAARPARAAMS